MDKSPTDKCIMASATPPDKWDISILDPLGKNKLSIFGFSHVYMCRTFSKSLIECLVWTRICESNGQARNAIRNNAVSVNRVKIKDVSYIISVKNVLTNIDAIVIEHGKYNFGIIELCD